MTLAARSSSRWKARGERDAARAWMLRELLEEFQNAARRPAFDPLAQSAELRIGRTDFVECAHNAVVPPVLAQGAAEKPAEVRVARKLETLDRLHQLIDEDEKQLAFGAEVEIERS